MKKEVFKQVHFCDKCGKEEYVYRCMGCGSEFCFDCMKESMIEYHHAVNFSGSGDGLFCKICDASPPPMVADLWWAYRQVKRLKKEAKAFYDSLDKRSKAAEAEVEKLYARYEEAN